MAIEIPDALIAKATGLRSKSILLSGGRTAIVREANGDDSIEGLAAAGEGANPTAMFYAVVARCTAIDGQQLTYDAFRKLSFGVIRKLTEAYNDLNTDKPDPLPAPDAQAGEGGQSSPAASSGA